MNVVGSSLDLRLLKWPADLHYVVGTEVVANDEHGTWLGIREGTLVRRGAKGTLPAPSSALVLVPPDSRWIARWYDPGSRGGRGRAGRFRMYVDITSVPEVCDREVSAVDLDYDVAVTWEGEFVLLDEEEFRMNTALRGYPQDVQRGVPRTAQTILDQAASGRAPFDGARASGLLSSWL